MGEFVSQGDILKIERINFPILAVSKNFFNQSGEIVGCPIFIQSTPGPLHIKVDTEQLSGYVLCEQLKLLDLRTRGYKKIAELKWDDKINIADAVQSIFEYV